MSKVEPSRTAAALPRRIADPQFAGAGSGSSTVPGQLPDLSTGQQIDQRSQVPGERWLRRRHLSPQTR